MITSPQSSDDSSHSISNTTDPVPSRPVLDLAKRGLRLSAISILLFVGGPVIIVVLVPIVGRIRIGPLKDITSLVFFFAAALYISSIPTTALAGIVNSLKALIRLRKEHGRFTGYMHATAGLVLGGGMLLAFLLLAILVVQNLYYSGDLDRT